MAWSSPLDSDVEASEGLAGLVEFGLEEMEASFSDDAGAVVRVRVVGYPRDAGQVVACTGQTLWRGGDALAAWCWRSRVRGRCLELGAGLGLCSLVAEECGASVVATDGDELALERLRKNTRDKRVEVRQLRWGEDGHIADILREFGTFDLLLGGDVLYDERAVEPLVSTVAALLAPGGTFVFSFTHRGVDLEKMTTAARDAGFCFEVATPLPDCVLLFRRRRRTSS
ncbi:hypothetical protein CTAYLR_002246 [Chrysophaeum taylorii]|uniref:Methyltransferase domain-containing protein n=1 Tax=Chrysophaeum taylorii TaxID=2483200 RepID=A0AAD7XQ61_9STRA|nr:hypothetical protein CTAYLR_002246 [Chrysophaeum taylorii]